MKYKILVDDNATDLTEQVNAHLEDKWEVVGPHQVVNRKTQNRYSGDRHMDSFSHLEYTQTMIKTEWYGNQNQTPTNQGE